jgi:hypothetical protein
MRPIQDCLSAIAKLIPSGKAKRKSGENIMDIDSNDEFPIDEIVDILIGFLESPTSFSRTIATFVFAHLTSEIGPTTVDFILKVCIANGGVDALINEYKSLAIRREGSGRR